MPSLKSYCILNLILFYCIVVGYIYIHIYNIDTDIDIEIKVASRPF